ncbi:ATPase AAA-type core [Penicillium longicatenatum]|nr:ATPase AAA-type core [Penicillium longicatenatum]
MAWTIHRVHCTRAESHEDHSKISYFEDAPRLFKGDCKASALRGKIGISDISEYLAARPHLKFVMYRIYNCNAYHATMDNHFRHLERPTNPFDKSLLPFFYILDSDGRPAKSHNEAMLVSSEDLLDVLHRLTHLDMKVLNGLDQPQNTRILATRLYRYRWVRDNPTALGEMNPSSATMAIEMFDFIEDMFGDEYDEADALFAEGLVTEFHLPKLFSQDDLLITMQRGEPCAYKYDFVPEYSHEKAIPLGCWAWRFDGQFWRYQTSFNVEVPSKVSQMPITDLSIYPLKYAADGLRERL